MEQRVKSPTKVKLKNLTLLKIDLKLITKYNIHCHYQIFVCTKTSFLSEVKLKIKEVLVNFFEPIT